MPVHIKPQDKTPFEKVEFALHPALCKRLSDYAKSFDDSDPSYILAQILDQVLPADRAAKPPVSTPPKRPPRTKSASSPADVLTLKAVANA